MGQRGLHACCLQGKKNKQKMLASCELKRAQKQAQTYGFHPVCHTISVRRCVIVCVTVHYLVCEFRLFNCYRFVPFNTSWFDLFAPTNYLGTHDSNPRDKIRGLLCYVTNPDNMLCYETK